MRWDLGWQGIGVLAGLSLAFGVVAQPLFRRRFAWWVGPLAAGISVVGGLLISEVVFGWATAEDLQPNIDGLSFDEVLVGDLIGIVGLGIVRFLVRDRIHDTTRRHSSAPLG